MPSAENMSSTFTPKFGEEPKTEKAAAEAAAGYAYFEEIRTPKGKPRGKPIRAIFIGEVSLEVFGGGPLEVVPGRTSMKGNNIVTMCTYFVIKSENEANAMLDESIHYVNTVGTVNVYPPLPE